MAGARSETGNRSAFPRLRRSGDIRRVREKREGRYYGGPLRQERAVRTRIQFTGHARGASWTTRLANPGGFAGATRGAPLISYQNLNVQALARCSASVSPLLLRIYGSSAYDKRDLSAPHRVLSTLRVSSNSIDASRKRKCVPARLFGLYAASLAASRNAGSKISLSPTQITAPLAEPGS